MEQSLNDAIKILQKSRDAMQGSRYMTLTEADEDAAWMNGFDHAITVLKESCIVCFKRLRDDGPCGVWVMRATDGVFIHGNRMEIQGSRYTVKDLESMAQDGVLKISLNEAIKEVSDWPLALDVVRRFTMGGEQ